MKAFQVSIYVVLFLIILSCAKKHEAPSCTSLLTKTTIHYTGGGSSYDIITDYEYNSEQSLIKVTQKYNSTIKVDTIYYSGKVVSKIRTTNHGGGIDYVQENIWTNSNGRVASIKSYLTSSLSDTTGVNFFYNSLGSLDSTNNVVSGSLNGHGTKYNYDASGNLMSNFVYDVVGVSAKYSYQGYDTKKNPYSLLATGIHQPQFSTSDGSVDAFNLLIHNPATFQRTTDPVASTNLTYQYNGQDYPTKSSRTDSNGSAMTTDFEYACP